MSSIIPNWERILLSFKHRLAKRLNANLSMSKHSQILQFTAKKVNAFLKTSIFTMLSDSPILQFIAFLVNLAK